MRRTLRLSRTITSSSTTSSSTATTTTTTSSSGGGFVVASSTVTAHPEEAVSNSAANRSSTDGERLGGHATAGTSSTTTSASAVGMSLSTNLFGTEVMLPDTEQYSSVSPDAEIDLGSFRVYETAPVSDLIWHPSVCDRAVLDRTDRVARLLDQYRANGPGATSGDTWVHDMAHDMGLNASTDCDLAAESVTCRVETELLCSRAVVELPMGMASTGASCCVCRCTQAELSSVSLRLFSVQPCGHLLCQQCYAKLFGMSETDDRPPQRYGQVALVTRLGVLSSSVTDDSEQSRVLCPMCRTVLVQDVAEIGRVLETICRWNLHLRCQVYNRATAIYMTRMKIFREGVDVTRQRAEHAERSCRRLCDQRDMSRRARISLLSRNMLPSTDYSPPPRFLSMSGAGSSSSSRRRPQTSSSTGRSAAADRSFASATPSGRSRSSPNKKKRSKTEEVILSSSSSDEETD